MNPPPEWTHEPELSPDTREPTPAKPATQPPAPNRALVFLIKTVLSLHSCLPGRVLLACIILGFTTVIPVLLFTCLPEGSQSMYKGFFVAGLPFMIFGTLIQSREISLLGVAIFLGLGSLGAISACHP